MGTRLSCVFVTLLCVSLTGCAGCGEDPVDPGEVDAGGGGGGGGGDGGTDAGGTPQDSGLVDAGVVVGEGLCNDAGFCFLNPLPHGWDFTAVHGSSATDVWAVGRDGTLLHHDGGGEWASVEGAAGRDLVDVHALSGGEVWVTGPGLLLHRQDGGWVDRVVQGFNGGTKIRSNAAGALYIASEASDDRELWRWDGGALEAILNPAFFPPSGLWVFDDGAVWATTLNSQLYRLDGGALELHPTQPGISAISGLWASGPTDVWASTFGGVRRFDGATWGASPVDAGQGPSPVFGTSASNVWVGTTGGVIRWNGATAQNFLLSGGPVGIWAADEEHAFAVGTNGRHYQFADGGWAQRGGFGHHRPLSAVWGHSAQDVWLGGTGMLRAKDGRVTDYSAQVNGVIRSIWGTSENDVWAVGEKGATFHFDGNGWTARPVRASDGGTFFHNFVRVMGAGPNEVYATTSVDFGRDRSDVYRWDGQRWTRLYEHASGGVFSERLDGLWVFGPSDVWVVGERGAVVHFDGGSWTPAGTHPSGLYSLFSPGGSELYANGFDGLYKRDGGGWDKVASLQFGFEAASLRGGPPGTIFAGTSEGLFSLDGGGFEPVETGLRQAVGDVLWTDGGTFVVGRSGGVVRRR